MRTNSWKKATALSIVMAMMLTLSTVPSWATINRGTVSIDGASALDLKVGETAKLTIDPYEDQQMEGCGMAECPDICGDQCMSGNNCQCSGTDFKTYKAKVKVTSSDDSVAKASYAKGTVTVKGVAEGTATISVQADLREWTGATLETEITVNPADKKDANSSDSSSSSSGSKGSKSTSSSSSSSDKATTDKKDDSAETNDTASSSSTTGSSNETVKETFSDVTGWAKDDIYYLAAKGILAGKTKDSFAPKDAVTRAEFVKILAGIANVDVSPLNGNTGFTDVKASSWYAKYIQWANDQNIIQGSNGQFQPQAQITRQDMAVMICRFIENVEKKTLAEKKEVGTFFDDAQISAYAKTSVNQLQKAGLINGTNDNRFLPKNNATREEAASLLANLLREMEGMTTATGNVKNESINK